MVLLSSFPPRRDRRRRRCAAVKRFEKIDYDRPLDCGERAVPYEINGDLALEKSSVVVLHRERLLLDQSRELPRRAHGGLDERCQQTRQKQETPIPEAIFWSHVDVLYWSERVREREKFIVGEGGEQL